MSSDAVTPSLRRSSMPLLWQLVRRDVRQRYQGSMLGVLWTLLMPLLMLGIYTFVFSVVFQARWHDPNTGGEAVGTAEFALILFAGLSVHLFFSECLVRAPQLIINHASYVTRVVFPLHLLPVMMVISVGFHYLTTTAVLLGFAIMVKGGLPLTALWLPVVLVPMVMLLLGLSWLLASLGVFLRDLGHLMQLVPTVLLFLSPIFYPAHALPETYRPYLHLNPLTSVVENVRQILLFGHPPAWNGLLLYSLVGCGVMMGGYWWFQRTRNAFADVM